MIERLIIQALNNSSVQLQSEAERRAYDDLFNQKIFLM